MTDLAQPSSPPPQAALTLAPTESTTAPTIPPAFVVRIWSLFTATICFGMLGLGLYLTPSADGFGKSRGLFGMPPCGFYTLTGYPCPTCGCTTAVSHFAHGHVVTSFLTQPFGFTVALVALIAGALSLVGLITGKWFGPAMFTLQWYWRVWVFGGIGMLVFGWVYKCMMIRLGAG